MCAGGIPFQTDNHAYKIILAAFEIIDFVEQSKNIVVENRINFKVRIGVNSGSVAGIVGTKSLPMTSGETQLTSPLAWSQTQLQGKSMKTLFN
jgi:hypothetical protein